MTDINMTDIDMTDVGAASVDLFCRNRFRRLPARPGDRGAPNSPTATRLARLLPGGQVGEVAG
ncbi:hypothetical protein ACFWWS_37825, partial [Streptomyces sp. NPDC059083]|uniref:hypothetical protein n=1 Tax=Streptomyces sp. NPDC059083 TaxID=3346721 RepID=UPI0036C3DFEB